MDPTSEHILHAQGRRRHLNTFSMCALVRFADIFTRFHFAPSPTLIIAVSATLAQTGTPDLCAAHAK